MYYQAHISGCIYPIFFHKRNMTQAKRHATSWAKDHHPDAKPDRWFDLSATAHRRKVSGEVYLTVNALTDNQIPSWSNDRIMNPRRRRKD